MADSNQLKRVDPVELNDDDPFAELTKIMGFDPRVPVRPASEQDVAPFAGAPTSAADFDLSEDDLGIDLEKELLGELSLEDEGVPLAHSAEPMFQSQPVAHEVDLDPNLDVAIAADLYGSFSQQDSAAQSVDSAPGHEPLLSDVDFDAAFERELAIGQHVAPEQAEVVNEAAAQDHLAPEDAALLAALDLPDDVDAPVGLQSVVVDDVAPAHSYAAEDPDFDLAMAEVDMDFSVDVEASEPAIAGYGAPVISQWDSPVSYEQGAIDFADAEEPALEEAEALQAVAAAPQQAFVQEAIVEQPVPAVAPSEPEPEELSLEDELNALLGNSVPRAQLTGGYDAPPLTAALAHPEEFSTSRDDYAGRAFDDRGHEQDYADDAVDDYAGPSYRVAEVAHGVQADQGAPHYVEQEQPEVEDLEFDDHAFHAAFEKSLGSEDFPVNATRSSDFDYYQPEASSAAYAGTAFSEVPSWSTSNSANDADVPDIETIDVPESAVAVADDLDIPEVAYEEEVRSAPVFDEFEAEFAAVYAEPQPVEEPVPSAAPHVERGYDEDHLQAQSAQFDYASGVAAAAVGAGAAYAAAGRMPAQSHFDAVQGFDVDNLPSSLKPTTGNADPFAVMDYNDGDEETAIPPYAEPRRAPRRRGLVVAAVAGGVAVLGGLGVFALSFGGDEAGAPAIVKADATPTKVRPENPGGATVPNQDNKVYQTVAGGGGAPAPTQEKLITSSEQPVDMAAKAPEPEFAPPAGVDDEEGFDGGDEIAAITGKAEDRVLPSAVSEQPETDNTEVAAVTPRRVRTMVVRPDGTLVPREDPAPAASAEPQAAASAIMEASVNAPADANAAGSASAAVAPNAASNAGAASSVTPASVPIAPARPADQPVNVVGEIKPQQVAAVDTAAPAAAGAWSMQIASQPSEDAAKSTYQDLTRRYGSVLSGRDVAIVKAEVAGKGTFWRVRVPAGSRNDAISLCESYKAAGGSCFVSK